MVEDRSKRYANPPKAPKKNGGAPPEEGTAERKAEATAGRGMPSDEHPGPVGKVGSDPGPEGGHDQTFGVIAARHKQEHAGMLKRHGEEHSGMVERHHKEAKEMHGRHAKEMEDHFESGAEASAERTAGSPEELGSEKSEGKKGAEV